MFNNPDESVDEASPEDLINASRPILSATREAVKAIQSNKQDDIINVANHGRIAVSQLLLTCKVSLKILSYKICLAIFSLH